MKHHASRCGVFGIVALLLATPLPLSAQEPKLLHTMTHWSRDRDYGDPVAVAFSGDGNTLAAATDGTFVSLWDVGTGKQVGTLKKGWPDAGVEIVRPSAVAFTADLKLLAVGVGGKEAKVYFWEMPSTKKADE